MSAREFDLGTGYLYWVAVAVLTGLAGALLALGCDARNVSSDEVSASGSAASEREMADLEKQIVASDRGAEREIAQARANSEKMPVASRDRLAEAIERTEEARDEASDRLDELKQSGTRHWEADGSASSKRWTSSNRRATTWWRRSRAASRRCPMAEHFVETLALAAIRKVDDFGGSA